MQSLLFGVYANGLEQMDGDSSKWTGTPANRKTQANGRGLKQWSAYLLCFVSGDSSKWKYLGPSRHVPCPPGWLGAEAAGTAAEAESGRSGLCLLFRSFCVFGLGGVGGSQKNILGCFCGDVVICGVVCVFVLLSHFQVTLACLCLETGDSNSRSS